MDTNGVVYILTTKVYTFVTSISDTDMGTYQRSEILPGVSRRKTTSKETNQRRFLYSPDQTHRLSYFIFVSLRSNTKTSGKILLNETLFG